MKYFKLAFMILVLIAIISVGIFAYTTCTGTPLIKRIDKTSPDDTIAVPYQVTTETHLYYCKKAQKNDDGSVTMFEWYEHSKNKWIYHSESITLPKVLNPKVSAR